MSLNYYLTDIKDFEEVCYIEDEKGESVLSPKTHALVFSTLNNGFNEITEKNAAEFYARSKMLEFIYGRFYNEYPIEPEDVCRHIGLRTNGSLKSRATFLRDLGMRIDDMARDFKRAIHGKEGKVVSGS